MSDECLVKCGCDALTYKYDHQTQHVHFSSKVHQDWVKTDFVNLHQKIVVICPCQGNFNYETQSVHLTSLEHLNWQKTENDRLNLPTICECSFIVPFKFLADHRASAVHVELKYENPSTLL